MLRCAIARRAYHQAVRALAACIVILGAAANASAAPKLTWRVPPGCPDESALRHAIERRLELSLDAVDVAIDVAIDTTPEGFTARIDAHGVIDESRTLSSTSCSELTDAVAVVIARIATEAHAAMPPAPRPPPPAPPPVLRATTSRDDWNTGVRVSGIVGTGGAPSIGIAGELAAWLSWRDVGIEISGTRWLAGTATLDHSSSGVEVSLEAVALRAGWWPADHWVRAWIVGETGTVDGTGVALTTDRMGTARWLAAGGGAGIAVPIAPHVGVIASSELEIAIDHVGFALDTGEIIYRTPSVALRAGLGLEVRWR